MHILHVSSATSWRGGEQQMAYLASELEKLGIRQTILCAKDSPMEKFCVQQELPFVSVKKRTALGLNFASKMKGLKKELGVSMVHVHDAHAHNFAFLANVLLGAHVPIIVSRRVDFPIKPGRFSRWKYNHPSVVKIICVSEAIQKITGADIDDQSVLTTIYSCIDANKFGPKGTNRLKQEYNIPLDAQLVGNVAALAPHKDYFTFIDTAEKVIAEKENVYFLAIGDGPQKDEIYEYAAQKKLDNRFIFTGFRKDIPAILPELDVFLISSETEGLGTSILDAFAAKVPVVATMAGGIPEIVIHQQTGLLCEIKNASKLAENCIKMLENDDLRLKIIEKSHEFVQNFNPASLAKNTLTEYTKIYQALQEG